MTTVELFKDIGFDMTMKRTMDFASKSAQNTWFSSRVSKTISDVAFNKLQNILKLPMDYGEALSYTYVRFKNLDSSGRLYYYFIAAIELVDDSTVAMHLAVDPLQTFMTEWSVGPCMVNRKHCDRWGSKSIPIRDNSNNEGIQGTYIPKVTQVINHTTGKYRVGAVVFTYTDTTTKQFTICFVPWVFGTYLSQYIKINDTTYNVPSLWDCFNNNIFNQLEIDPESVVSMCFLPFMPIEAANTGTASVVWNFPAAQNYVISGNYACVVLTATETRYFTLNVNRPSKPSDGVQYSSNYEPALYKEPYTVRKLISIDGIFNQDIPDYIINQESNILYLKAQISPSQQTIFCSVNKTMTDVAAMAGNKEAGQVAAVMPSAFDVRNNAWQTYALTQRDSDRAIINNNNMQNMISNLLFMGYGGALVGSRGGGIIKDNPIYDNATGIPKSQQAILGYKRGINSAIPGAVGLAAGASIVTSLVDAHYAWENQKQQERKIQNKASQITISGNSAYRNAEDNYTAPVYVEMVVDDVNYNKAASNFRYYGYEINEWQVPNIKSRKYFDYILTNGAIINGSVPQDIKEQIAKVLDNGITFFHADYSSSTEYNDYENIERALI